MGKNYRRVNEYRCLYFSTFVDILQHISLYLAKIIVNNIYVLIKECASYGEARRKGDPVGSFSMPVNGIFARSLSWDGSREYCQNKKINYIVRIYA